MISISNKRLSKVSKLILVVIIGYSSVFMLYRAITYYKIYFEKDSSEVKRNKQLGRKIFCSRSCVGKNNIPILSKFFYFNNTL